MDNIIVNAETAWQHDGDKFFIEEFFKRLLKIIANCLTIIN